MDNTGVSKSPANPIKFRCPGCQAVLQAPPKYAGKRVKCNQCSQLLQVPGTPPQRSEALKPKEFTICICGSCKHIFKTPPGQTESSVTCPSCNHGIEIPKQSGQVTDSGTMRFHCTSCRQDYCVLSKYGGKKFTCLACKESTGIPIPAPPKPSLDLVSPEVLDEPEVLEEEPPMYQLKDEPEEQGVQPPQEYDLGQVQQTAPGRSGRKKKTKSSQGSAMSKLKVPIIAISAVVGFIIGFVAISSLFKAASGNNSSAPVQSPEAIAFAEDTIQMLHAMEQGDLEFHDSMAVDSDDLNKLAYAVSLGDIDNIDSEVTFSKVGHGAEGYVVESVITYSGQFTRTVQAGICIGTEWIKDDDGYIIDSGEVSSKLLGMRVLDADETELAAIGETDDFLIAQLNTFVNENSFFSAENMGVICGFWLGLLVVVMVVLSFQGIVFHKAGEPGWAAFVPIYHYVVMARLADKSAAIGVLCALAFFIPFGNLIYLWLIITFSIGIANCFGRGTLFGLGLAFFPVIFYPILAFTADS